MSTRQPATSTTTSSTPLRLPYAQYRVAAHSLSGLPADPTALHEHMLAPAARPVRESAAMGCVLPEEDLTPIPPIVDPRRAGASPPCAHVVLRPDAVYVIRAHNPGRASTGWGIWRVSGNIVHRLHTRRAPLASGNLPTAGAELARTLSKPRSAVRRWVEWSDAAETDYLDCSVPALSATIHETVNSETSDAFRAAWSHTGYSNVLLASLAAVCCATDLGDECTTTDRAHLESLVRRALSINAATAADQEASSDV